MASLTAKLRRSDWEKVGKNAWQKTEYRSIGFVIVWRIKKLGRGKWDLYHFGQSQHFTTLNAEIDGVFTTRKLFAHLCRFKLIAYQLRIPEKGF